jgi:nicotinamidase-related amidase
MDKRMLKLPVRYYQIAQLYGPGMSPSAREGHHERVLEKPPGQIGLVLVHCWNLGEPDGPYPIGDDAHIPGRAGDWVPTGHEIIRQHTKPVLDAARQAGIEVFHLAQPKYAPRYESYKRIKKDPAMREPRSPKYDGCVRPRPYQQQHDDEYGVDFPGCVWETHSESFDIAKALRPVGDEPVIVNGWQLNQLARKKDIDTLLYAGFMADLCLINSSGAMREMANTYRYNCVVLRECTTAYEYEDTYEGRWMTKSAIRRMETELGYSASSKDFIEAAKEAGT